MKRLTFLLLRTIDLCRFVRLFKRMRERESWEDPRQTVLMSNGMWVVFLQNRRDNGVKEANKIRPEPWKAFSTVLGEREKNENIVASIWTIMEVSSEAAFFSTACFELWRLWNGPVGMWWGWILRDVKNTLFELQDLDFGGPVVDLLSPEGVCLGWLWTKGERVHAPGRGVHVSPTRTWCLCILSIQN